MTPNHKSRYCTSPFCFVPYGSVILAIVSSSKPDLFLDDDASFPASSICVGRFQEQTFSKNMNKDTKIKSRKRKTMEVSTIDNARNPLYAHLVFDRWMETFFGRFLSDLDLSILKTTCKQMCSFIRGYCAKRPTSHDQTTRKKVPMILTAVSQGFFSLALNYMPREWRESLFLQERYMIACSNLPKDPSESKAQLDLASALFCGTIKMPEACTWACESGNLPLLRHLVEVCKFPLTRRCSDAAFRQKHKEIIEYLRSKMPRKHFGYSMAHYGEEQDIATAIHEFKLNIDKIPCKKIVRSRDMKLIETSTENLMKHPLDEFGLEEMAHKAGKMGFVEAIDHLAEKKPDLLATALGGALKVSNLELANSIERKAKDFKVDLFSEGEHLIIRVLRSGSSQAFEWLSQRCPFQELEYLPHKINLNQALIDRLVSDERYMYMIYEALLRDGPLDLLKWFHETHGAKYLRKNERQSSVANFPWAPLFSCKKEVAEYAWSIYEQFPSGIASDHWHRLMIPDLARKAAESGCLLMVKKCLEKGCPVTQDLLLSSIESQDFDLIRFMLPWKGKKTPKVIEKAIETGDLQLMILFVEAGFPVGKDSFDQAIMMNSLTIARWLMVNGFVTQKMIQKESENYSETDSISTFLKQNSKFDFRKYRVNK